MSANPKNTQTSYRLVQYGSGPWDGKWVVRRIVEEDVAATLTEIDAKRLISMLEGDAA